LVRSHAIALIPDTRPTEKNNSDGYEPDTEQEMVCVSDYKDLDDEDDLETPKKKKKGDKPKVRDLIETQRDDFAILQEDMEVSVTLLELRVVTSRSCLIRFVKLSLLALARACHCSFMPHLSYLILNELTLFYFDLSASKTSRTGKIQSWTAQVAKANKKSKVPASGTATSATAIRTTASSSAVVAQAAPTTKKKAKLEPEPDNSASAFLDEDESAEREAALASPIKGRKRLTTKVGCNS
jgi:hypothetical protein